MGVVYRAHDTALDRPVALKLLRPDLYDSEQARARFLREARVAAAVRSDHVVTTFQVGEENGIPYAAGRPAAAQARHRRHRPDAAAGRLARVGANPAGASTAAAPPMAV